MNKRRSEVEMIVGVEMADELASHLNKLKVATRRTAQEMGRFTEAIVLKDDPADLLVLPQKHLAGFECEYCRNTYVVDLLNQAVKCQGCDHGAPYEAVMLALNPIHQRHQLQEPFKPGNGLPQILPGSGSYPHPDNIRYEIATGTHSYPNRYDQIAGTIRFSQELRIPPNFTPEYYNIVSWKGEQITSENLMRVHQEMVEFDIDINVINSVLRRFG